MITKKKESLKIIATFPFSSERKRMSIIVKDEFGNHILYTKGADSVMLDRIDY
jgi:magnesium-transporting ATPase (P-type)